MLVPARIGYARAFSMFALGEAVDGRTAAAWGLANAAVPAGDPARPRARSGWRPSQRGRQGRFASPRN